MLNFDHKFASGGTLDKDPIINLTFPFCNVQPNQIARCDSFGEFYKSPTIFDLD